MVVPWLGFTMKRIIDDVEPTSEARYVRFISYYNRKINKGPGRNRSRPWPYTEGLRTDEMANELAFFAIGIYGHELPKQHGAPIRQVIPWKYGFKGAKSIVKMSSSTINRRHSGMNFNRMNTGLKRMSSLMCRTHAGGRKRLTTDDW